MLVGYYKRGCWMLAVLVLFGPAQGAFGQVQATSATSPADNLPPPIQMALERGDTRSLADEDLTRTAAHWQHLSAPQRRALLSEMRVRMARSEAQRQKFRAALSRQYGSVIRKVRRVRQPDGSVLVETRVVRVRSAPASRAVPQARVTFGIGFEQRSRGQPSDDAGRAPSGAGGIPARQTASQPSADRTDG